MVTQGNNKQVCTCTDTACTSDRMPRGAELTSGCSLAISQTLLLLSANTHLIQHQSPSVMATFRDAGISGDFVHTSLSNPQAEIRFVQIDLSGDKDREIQCTISTHPIEDTPPYVAISYTWGDISKKREIWINEKRLNIGQSSWLALLQARLHRVQQPLMVWMDVLSIDQTNDVEKSMQVGLMGRIFLFAELVLAGVGEHEDDSEHLI